MNNLSEKNSIANQFVAELRDIQIQQDRMRFRRNMERIGEILAYEISKTFRYKAENVETQLGFAKVKTPQNSIVLATILRAGLPFHQGFLNYFDSADNAFISAFRKHHKDGSFEIQLDYVATADLDGATLILCDPMLATGASINITLKELLKLGTPESIHIAAIIASTTGVEGVRRQYPQAKIWTAALDEELTAKSYIVPGLGDAGDLAFGIKMN